jgi:MFS family permease
VTATAASAPAPRAPTRLVVVLIGVTMVVSIISSLGAPLLPSVARMLHVAVGDAQWSLTAALLSGTVASPIMGRLGDGPFRRETILAGLGVVVAGSVIAGLAQSLPVLVVGRAMQGIGLGLAPLTMAAARDHLPTDHAASVIGVLSVTAAAGVGAGYPLSGLIAQDIDVHAAFLFGGVIAGAALIAAALVIPSSRASSRMRLDVSGAALIAIGLISLLLAIEQGARWGWGSPAIIGLFAGAAAVLAGWAYTQLHRDTPLVNLRELRHRSVLTADAAAVVLGVAMYLFLTLVTEFIQARPGDHYGFGSSPLVAGLALVPFSVTSLAASRTAPALTRRIGATPVLVAGTLTVALAGAFFALEHRRLFEAFVTMGVIGVGFGYTYAVIPSLISRSVPRTELGSALGLYQVIRYVGFSVGSALSASILASETPAGGTVPTVHGYVIGLWVGAGVCVCSACLSLVLGRDGRGGGPGGGDRPPRQDHIPPAAAPAPRAVAAAGRARRARP